MRIRPYYIRNTRIQSFHKENKSEKTDDLVALQRRKQLYRHARRFEAARRKPIGSWPLYANYAESRLIGWVNILRVNHSSSAGGRERAREVLLHLSACQPVCAPAHCTAASPEHVPLLNSQAAGLESKFSGCFLLLLNYKLMFFVGRSILKLVGVLLMFVGALQEDYENTRKF